MEFDKVESSEWFNKELEKAGMKAALEMSKAFMTRFGITEIEFTPEEVTAATTKGMSASKTGENLVFKRKVSK